MVAVATMSAGCLDDLDAFALVGGTLPPDRLSEVVAHVEACPECHELIEGLCADTPNTERGPMGDSLVGIEVDGYRIGALLATGGMGRVYRATELAGARDVALKVPRTQARWIVRRFEREVAITARLGQPATPAGIVPLLGSGKLSDGTPYYVMPLVDGMSLEAALGRAMNRDQRLALLGHLVAVAGTMAFVHERGIAHRDLKPHNVLVGRSGETVILDWGLAKDLASSAPAPALPMASPGEPTSVVQMLAGRTTRPGDVLGTPAFMSPEQARGDDVDQRSDVYALGAMLEQLLVGRLPRKAADAALEQAPPELVAICRRAMAADRDARYADGGAFSAALRAATETRDTRETGERPAPVATTSPRWWILAAVVLVIVMAVALGWR